jgi:thiosulfate/3-mercaptopyruvate sulfurtransferase
MASYAHPEVLVSTQWIQDHADDPNVRIVEVDVDTSAYDEGHVAGAVGWSWNTQLCDTVQRDILSQEEFENLMSTSGIGNDTTVVLYGDNNNWFAAWALWQMKIYGHKDARAPDERRPQEVDGGGPTSNEGRRLTGDDKVQRDSSRQLAARIPH